MFNKAAACIGDKNYEEALYLLEELYFVLEEAKRLLGYSDEGVDDRNTVEVDLKVLLDDVRVHKFLADSLKEIHGGDVVLDEAVNGYETIQEELVYNAVDKYRYAMMLSRGEDLEILCIAYTKIASVYLKVFNMPIHKQKAKEYLNDVMDFSRLMYGNM